MTNLQTYLEFATETAYLAGKLTLGYFQAGVRPDMKSDDTPVTVADRGAEELVRARIEQRYPGHTVLGEEFGETAGADASHRWIVDPIDGTKAFIRGVPLYAVLLGLEIEGRVEVGVSYFPALDEMIYAATGHGCWWNGRRARVSQVASLDRAFVTTTDAGSFARHGRESCLAAAGSRDLPPGRLERRLRPLPGGHRPRRAGVGPDHERLGLRPLPTDSPRGRRLLRRLAGQRDDLWQRGYLDYANAVAAGVGIDSR